MTLGARSSLRSVFSRARPRIGAGLLIASLGSPACKSKPTAAAPSAAQPAAATRPASAASSGASALGEAPAPGEARAVREPSAPEAIAIASGAAPPAAGAGDAGSELIVGSERGLEAYALDGASRRSISAGPALHPRWLDAKTLLVLAPRDAQGLWAGATLQRVALDGRREDVAVLPPFACTQAAARGEDDSFPYQVDLQEGDDFQLAPRAGLACLRLLDRNVNMASVILDVQVDLRSRRVERWQVAGDDVCSPPRGVRRGTPTRSCSKGGVAPSAQPPSTYPFDMPNADGRVIQTRSQSANTALQLGLDYSPEARSPSGRWLVLGGDTEEGDYLYRRLSLLDRESGRVYPILEATGAWPAALEPSAGSPPTLRHPIERAVLVPGETEVRWLSTRGGELLVVGSAVVRPGVGSFTVDGEIAR